MGTFHHGKGDLHGITVVVDTPGSRLYVGRCDSVTPEGVILCDVDVHDEEETGVGKSAYVAKAARVGTWTKHDRLVVPAAEVASIRRLGDLARA